MADEKAKAAKVEKTEEVPVGFHAGPNAPDTVVVDDLRPEVKPTETEVEVGDATVTVSNTITDADHRQENPADRAEQEAYLRGLGVYASE